MLPAGPARVGERGQHRAGRVEVAPRADAQQITGKMLPGSASGVLAEIMQEAGVAAEYWSQADGPWRRQAASG